MTNATSIKKRPPSQVNVRYLIIVYSMTDESEQNDELHDSTEGTHIIYSVLHVGL